MDEKDIIWNNISKKIESRRRKIIFLNTGAVLLPIILLFFYLSPTVYQTSSQSISITLNDGTRVKLYPNSRLKFSNTIFSKTRNAELVGDALFSVSKDKKHPFIVKGEGFNTKVLGTVFKITQRKDVQSIYLIEGKVQVSKNSKVIQKLLPNQELTNYEKENIVSFKKNVYENKNTKTNTIASEIVKMDNTSLQNVVHHLESIYKTKIKYPVDMGQAPLSGDLQIGNLDENLRSIAFSLNLKIEKESKNYILK